MFNVFHVFHVFHEFHVFHVFLCVLCVLCVSAVHFLNVTLCCVYPSGFNIIVELKQEHMKHIFLSKA